MEINESDGPNSGDEVVTGTPGFPATFDIIQALGAVLKPLPLRFEDGYAIDMERLESLLTERTKLVLLLSPHNPSGVTTRHSVFESVLERMRAQSREGVYPLQSALRRLAGGLEPEKRLALARQLLDGLVARNLLFSAANGSAHGSAFAAAFASTLTSAFASPFASAFSSAFASAFASASTLTFTSDPPITTTSVTAGPDQN